MKPLNMEDFQREQHAKAHAFADDMVQQMLQTFASQDNMTAGALLMGMEMLTHALRAFLHEKCDVSPMDLMAIHLNGAECGREYFDTLVKHQDLLEAYVKRLEDAYPDVNTPAAEA